MYVVVVVVVVVGAVTHRGSSSADFISTICPDPELETCDSTVVRLRKDIAILLIGSRMSNTLSLMLLRQTAAVSGSKQSKA